MNDPLQRLRCPHCREGKLVPAEGALRCVACTKISALENGVAALVADFGTHAAELERARTINPLWYVEEQLPEATSPWRHHLKKRRLYVQKLLGSELKRRGTDKVPALLDLGCGDGNHLKWLSAYAEASYGCDYNMVRLARARAQNPQATIFLADILDFPAFDGSFDIIFFNHVIEHIRDDVRALQTVKRLLAPGGLLVLGTPNEGAWWWQLAYKRDPQSMETTDHVHFYTAETLTERMRATGLVIEEVHHMGWGPPDWRLDGRIRKYKIVDDAFELFGRALLPRQASSLYVAARPASVA